MNRSAILTALAAVACQSTTPSIPAGGFESYRRGFHDGPEVFYVPGTGTERHAEVMVDTFNTEAAMASAAFADRFYREAANEGYDATLDHLIDELRAAGFGEDEGFELRVDERDAGHPAWTPRRASLDLRLGASAVTSLHRFGPADDRDRCMLPVNAPAADVRGPIALSLDALTAGAVLVTERPLEEVLAAAEAGGAAAVLSSHLFEFNVDPTGAGRHRDAIHYGHVPVGTSLPVAHVSPRVHDEIRDAAREVAAELAFQAVVTFEERPLRTVIAVVAGGERSEEVVALVAHAQEPGANDNATGIAGLLEGARALKRAMEAGLARPRRSVAFVWGDELVASQVFLETTTRRPIAGISADMIGASKERTGAICLLERGPDPGALTPLPPDEHTPWGAGTVDPDTLIPNGLAVILRCALIDVGLAAPEWETSEHPWEGGSDHDVFLAAGVPGALIWHFTDFAYHTSLDRMDMVDPGELHRTACALVVGALGVADAWPSDLRRYVESSLAEGEMRAGAAELEGAPLAVAEQWVDWHHGTRRWLAALCSGETPPDRFRAK